MSTSEYTRQWRNEFRARDPDGYRAFRTEEARKYRLKHPYVAKVANAIWSAANLEKSKQLQKSWRERNPEYGREWRNQNLEKVIFKSAKRRAAVCGVAFSVSLEDVIVPNSCPILGIALNVFAKRGEDNAIEFDRVVPSLGYVPGNVAVISHRANFIKMHGTAKEHELIAAYIRQHGGE